MEFKHCYRPRTHDSWVKSTVSQTICHHTYSCNASSTKKKKNILSVTIIFKNIEVLPLKFPFPQRKVHLRLHKYVWCIQKEGSIVQQIILIPNTHEAHILIDMTTITHCIIMIIFQRGGFETTRGLSGTLSWSLFSRFHRNQHKTGSLA